MAGDGARHLAPLEHLLHQIKAAARAVALVAKQHVSGAGGDAEAAMDASFEHGFGAGESRVLKLGFAEVGVHGR